ncbi:hypothetical protein LPN01_00640 [Sphingomonas sp. A2-49]|uniref:hypothetical protein n=1 Tax=Sphingomonas sp. A2-49 TaxID=1391375 RepID=UPI0021D1A3BD|nr:hypothetical protein [Sphingomonas sp. A2-49]MCU6452580.1 hypothetical protein [Sphingomonas sp. A2-49]
MRCLSLLLVLTPTALHAGPLPGSRMPVLGAVPRACAAKATKRIGDRPPPPLRKLGDMPPAEPFYTVLREVDGCPIPVRVVTPLAAPRLRGG